MKVCIPAPHLPILYCDIDLILKLNLIDALMKYHQVGQKYNRDENSAIPAPKPHLSISNPETESVIYSILWMEGCLP